MSEQEAPVYRFAGCELDPAERRLLVQGQPVSLTPKVYDTLVLLVRHAGHAVSKDALMAALWPRGFVHESNLTKHIWLIRRALGDGEGESRFIETIPKLGYRFIAAVEEGTPARTPVVSGADADSEAPAGSPPSTVPEPWHRDRDPDRRIATQADEGAGQGVATRATRRRLAIGLACVALAAVAGWLVLRTRPAFAPVAATDAGAVAIVGFNNLSANPKDAWLGPALQQMLATEIAADGGVHAVSEELVRPASADLPPPDAGGYAPASLQALQRRLGMHYVLGGAYLVSGGDAAQLRIDITLQDATTGKLAASLSRAAAVSDLPRIVSGLGADLRRRFGIGAADPLLLRQTANAQPPTADVARHMGFALDALQRYDPARARDELLLAIAQAPAYAPAYAMLSKAYAAMGYRQQAVAAINMAQSHARTLAPGERQRIDLQSALQANDTARAIGIVRQLLRSQPGSVELRMQLAGLLADAGQQADADAALAQLRALPAAADDPRVELLAGRMAHKRGDSDVARTHAQTALRLAHGRGETGLVAAAQLDVGIYAGSSAAAEPGLRAAATDYHAVANPHGEALAYQNLGNLLRGRNAIAPAREAYQRAMSMYQAIGDLDGQAAVYDNLAGMLWSAGDRDGAGAAIGESLRIARETNDRVRQAWCLAALGQIRSDESAGDDVLDAFRQAVALDKATGERTHLVFALSSYADLLRVRGELDAARQACGEARDAARTLAPSDMLAPDFTCAQVALDRGEVEPARQALTALVARATGADDAFTAANARLLLGQLALGLHRWQDARGWLRQSLQAWRTADETAGQAVAGGLLALADARLGDAGASTADLKAARDARARSNQRFEVLPFDIAAAQLRGEQGDADARNALQSLAADAQSRHWTGMALDTRLALLEVDLRTHARSATTERDALAADARRGGFGWLLQRLPPTGAQ